MTSNLGLERIRTRLLSKRWCFHDMIYMIISSARSPCFFLTLLSLDVSNLSGRLCWSRILCCSYFRNNPVKASSVANILPSLSSACIQFLVRAKFVKDRKQLDGFDWKSYVLWRKHPNWWMTIRSCDIASQNQQTGWNDWTRDSEVSGDIETSFNSRFKYSMKQSKQQFWSVIPIDKT